MIKLKKRCRRRHTNLTMPNSGTLLVVFPVRAADWRFHPLPWLLYSPTIKVQPQCLYYMPEWNSSDTWPHQYWKCAGLPGKITVLGFFLALDHFLLSIFPECFFPLFDSFLVKPKGVLILLIIYPTRQKLVAKLNSWTHLCAVHPFGNNNFIGFCEAWGGWIMA